MANAQTPEVKMLKKTLEQEAPGGKEECTMCKFVLLFALVVFFLVLVFTFLLRIKPETGLTPLGREEAPEVSVEEWNTRIHELGHTLHGENFSNPET